jgi:hypothetical protein
MKHSAVKRLVSKFYIELSNVSAYKQALDKVWNFTGHQGLVLFNYLCHESDIVSKRLCIKDTSYKCSSVKDYQRVNVSCHLANELGLSSSNFRWQSLVTGKNAYFQITCGRTEQLSDPPMVSTNEISLRTILGSTRSYGNLTLWRRKRYSVSVTHQPTADHNYASTANRRRIGFNDDGGTKVNVKRPVVANCYDHSNWVRDINRKSVSADDPTLSSLPQHDEVMTTDCGTPVPCRDFKLSRSTVLGQSTSIKGRAAWSDRRRRKNQSSCCAEYRSHLISDQETLTCAKNAASCRLPGWESTCKR